VYVIQKRYARAPPASRKASLDRVFRTGRIRFSSHRVRPIRNGIRICTLKRRSALQTRLDQINTWVTQNQPWKILPRCIYSAQKRLLITETARSGRSQNLTSEIPRTYTRSTSNMRPPNLKSKRETLNNRLHLLRPIFESKLSIRSKSILYTSLLRPVWAYGTQIWGCAEPSQTRTKQAFQSISLRLIRPQPLGIPQT